MVVNEREPAIAEKPRRCAAFSTGD